MIKLKFEYYQPAYYTVLICCDILVKFLLNSNFRYYVYKTLQYTIIVSIVTIIA